MDHEDAAKPRHKAQNTLTGSHKTLPETESTEQSKPRKKGQQQKQKAPLAETAGALRKDPTRHTTPGAITATQALLQQPRATNEPKIGSFDGFRLGTEHLPEAPTQQIGRAKNDATKAREAWIDFPQALARLAAKRDHEAGP